MTVRRRPGLIFAATVALAAASPMIVEADTQGPPRPYSPYAQLDYPTRALFGDAHVHTGLSADAGAYGNGTGLDTAYRFARGEQVNSPTGVPAKLARPLDWLVITDHSDGMGFFSDLRAGDPSVLAFEEGRRWHAGIEAGGAESVKAAKDIISTFAQGRFPAELLAMYSPGSDKYRDVWEHVIAKAEEYNDPGVFTSLIGFEWTSLLKGNNLHRNVIFRDGADKAGQVVPYTTQAPIGSTDPMKLYEWLENYATRTGGAVLALAHNGNLSNGLMFPVDARHEGKVVDAAYVRERARWEPLYEWTQIKGDGEAHPILSPTDEFADYETWDEGNLDLSAAKTPDMIAGEYAREALKTGLLLQRKFGTNPYKFGAVGASDTHTSLAAVEEENFFGKHSAEEPRLVRIQRSFQKTAAGERMAWQMVSSGLAVVWARANTRDEIFAALQRKETYATTGTRMVVRFFGGWEFDDEDLLSREPASAGYRKGVPMGGDLPVRVSKGGPTFLAYARRDPLGANLDRIQVIKGWLDAAGKPREKIFNVAWSGKRQLDGDGKLPAVGDTVDVDHATWSNTIGAAELRTMWTDPEFDPAQSAFYYVRVLEIPTPRWVVYDAYRFGTPLPKDAVLKGQERAYTSPIWYTP